MNQKQSEEISCGYCMYELICDVHLARRKTNLAKLGCPCFHHYADAMFEPKYDVIEVTKFVNDLNKKDDTQS